MALPSLLKGLPDMERGITRIFHRTANPAEFVQVVQALVNIAPHLGVQVGTTTPTCRPVSYSYPFSRSMHRFSHACSISPAPALPPRYVGSQCQ